MTIIQTIRRLFRRSYSIDQVADRLFQKIIDPDLIDDTINVINANQGSTDELRKKYSLAITILRFFTIDYLLAIKFNNLAIIDKLRDELTSRFSAFVFSLDSPDPFRLFDECNRQIDQYKEAVTQPSNHHVHKAVGYVFSDAVGQQDAVVTLAGARTFAGVLTSVSDFLTDIKIT